jgi:hypothetical protein
MEGDNIDAENLDLIIKDLKTTFDSLENVDIEQSQGFQVKLAKTIASLRAMKVAKMTAASTPKDKESRNYLVNQLDFFVYMLENMDDSDQKKKFDLIMKIAKLREKINSL